MLVDSWSPASVWGERERDRGREEWLGNEFVKSTLIEKGVREKRGRNCPEEISGEREREREREIS